MIRTTKAGKLYNGGGGGSSDMFGELARTPVLLGLASDKWLDLEARLKIFVVFKVKKG